MFFILTFPQISFALAPPVRVLYSKRWIPTVQHGTPNRAGPDCFVGVSAKWRKACPTANFLVRYTKKETNGEMTEGQEEARELSAANYGRDEWWLLLNPVQEAEAGGACE